MKNHGAFIMLRDNTDCVLAYPGAEMIVFTFSEYTFVEDRADYLYVYDNNGDIVATYTNKEAAGQSVTIYGDSFSIRLVSDESYTEYGFSIESIVVTEVNGFCKNGHSWLAPSWIWANEYTTASAIFAFGLCADEMRFDAEIIIDGETYTAKVTGPDGKEYTDTKVAGSQEFVLGDVTGDGEVDANDLTALSRHVARIEEFTGEALLKAADVNSDGEVDANDLTVLSRFVAKIINSFD